MSGEAVRDRQTYRDARRGQTTIDFAVGAGVFLLVVAGIFAFVPTLFDPFLSGNTAGPVVAERTAAHLAEGLLVGDGGTAGTLSLPCTVAFFHPDASLANQPACRLDGKTDMDDLLGVSGTNVEVIIHGVDQPISNATTYDVDLDGTTYSGTFERSNAQSTQSDVTVARRVVTLDDDIYRLTVRVW